MSQWYAPYDNVLTGYRLDYSYRDCVKSMLTKHSETINIWSEFVPAVTFFIGWVYLCTGLPE